MLLNKLEYFGFSKHFTEIVWKVSFGSAECPLLPVNFGVPQGGILVPILFIFYINDISKGTNDVKFVIYADDTNIFSTDSSLNSLVSCSNDVLVAIKKWMSRK